MISFAVESFSRALKRYIGTHTFFRVLLWKNVEIFGKTAVFPGGYGRIGEVPHGRIWPDWGLKG